MGLAFIMHNITFCAMWLLTNTVHATIGCFSVYSLPYSLPALNRVKRSVETGKADNSGMHCL